jgi:hypothetical protein
MQGVVIADYEKAKIAERYRRGKLFRARAGEITSPKVTPSTCAPAVSTCSTGAADPR